MSRRRQVVRWRTAVAHLLRPGPVFEAGVDQAPGVAAIVRGRERDRRATLSAATALGARGVTLALTLVSVPLALNYLGTERFGMWLTISSVIALLSLSDLGIGYGLLNSITKSIAHRNIPQARKQISSSVALLGILAVVLAVVFVLALSIADWPHILGVRSSLARSEAVPSVLIFALIFLLGLPLSVATQVRVARQEAYVAHGAAAAGNLVAIMALLVVIATRQGVPALVLAMAAPPVAAVAVNGLLLFVRDAAELRPSSALVDWGVAFTLVKAGFLFLVLQASITVAFASDTLILAQVLGPDAVSEYGVAFRLFTIPIGLVAIGLTPLWPAYGDAIARGETEWARSTLQRSTRTALVIAVPAAIIFVTFGGWLVKIWVGDTVVPSLLLFVGLGVWTVQTSVGQSIAMFLNGANEIRLQAIAAAAMAVANVVLSVWLTTLIGAAGVVWGTVVTYAAFVLVPMAAYVPGVLRRVGEQRVAPDT